MSRHSNALRLALESEGAAAEETVIADTGEVDVSGPTDTKIENEDVIVAEADGETGEETIAVDGASDASAGEGPIPGDDGFEGDAPEVVADTDSVVVDGSDSAEEAVSDANAAEAEADSTADQKDELAEAAAGLESIYEMMAAAQQNGGLTRQNAHLATIAVESYTARCGETEPVMASLENFGGDSTRLRATSISLESIGETIQKYWKVVWAFVVKLKDQIWNFIKRLFSASERLAQRGARLAKLQLSGAANTPKIELKGYAKKIAVGTKVVLDPKRGMVDCMMLVNGVTGVAPDFEQKAAAMYNHVHNVAAGKAKAGDDDFAVEFALPKGFKMEGDKMVSAVMPGNFKFEAQQLVLRGGKIKLWNRVTKVKQEANISEEAKIDVMSPDQIKETGDCAVELMKQVTAARNATASAMQKSKSLKAPAVADGITDEDAKAAKELLTAFRTAEIQQANLTGKVCAAAVNAALTYLKVAEMSAKAYGAKAINTSDKPVANKKPAAAAAAA